MEPLRCVQWSVTAEGILRVGVRTVSLQEAGPRGSGEVVREKVTPLWGKGGALRAGRMPLEGMAPCSLSRSRSASPPGGPTLHVLQLISWEGAG